MNVRELLLAAQSLSVADRAAVVDALLRTLNQPDAELDSKWAVIAQQRLDDLRSGRVKAIDGDTVFRKIRERESS